MIFQNLRLKEKIWLLLFLSLLFCWWLFFAPGTCSASEPMYQITETELATLENNLAQLSAINNKLQMELAAQKRELHILKQESSTLLNQLNSLQLQSQKQQDLLTAANKSLEEYAIEEKNKRLRIKAQRNGYFIGMVAALAIAVCHR